MILSNRYTAVWEMVENLRYYLAIKHQKPILEQDIVKCLNLAGNTLAKYKNTNSSLFLAHLALYCVENNVDINIFCKYKNSVIISSK